MQDNVLLRRFAEHNSQAAFAEVVGRHLRLVYTTCLREVGDRQMAEDVTQGVFLILAQKAPSLGRHVPLAGWLFRTARLASKSAMRQEHRRSRWERAAAAERADPDARWGEGRHPRQDALNEALAALRPAEREAVLLRFFEELSFQEVGAALGLAEDTAQKRVSRALEKMRAHLVSAGGALSLAALVGVLSAEAAHSVPSACASPLLQIIPGLKIALETSGLFGSRPYQISQGVLRKMWITKAAAVMGLGVFGLGVGLGVVGIHAAPQSGHAQIGGGGAGDGSITPTEPLPIQEIHVTGNRHVPTSVILTHVTVKAGGTASEKQIMKALVVSVYNMGWFQKVGPYSLRKAASGRFVITLPVVENSSAKGAREWYKTHKP